VASFDRPEQLGIYYDSIVRPIIISSGRSSYLNVCNATIHLPHVII
jgi:hypothetical protein